MVCAVSAHCGGGARNRKSKAWWEQVRGAYERGEGSYQELAERFGVSKRTICRHGKDEAWEKTESLLRPEQRTMREVTQKLHSAAMREVERLEEQEADVKTIRDLTALVRELNQLAKCDREDRTESLRGQWGEETEQWSE